MLSSKVNDYITLKLENRKAQIYVNGKKFLQCIRLVLKIPINEVDDYEQINSIDEAADVNKNKTIWQNRIVQGPGARPDLIQEHDITPEQEFWGHCSNIQTWVENKYDLRLLHSNLSFPLLKELYKVGDPIAKQVFQEEIAMRLESGSPNVIEYLSRERYLDYLTKDQILSVIESPQFVGNLIKNAKDVRILNLIDSVLKFIAPHYFDQRAVSMNKRQLHNISPDIMESFGNVVCQLLRSGRLKPVRKDVQEYQSLGIVVNFTMQNKEFKKVVHLSKAILEIFPDSSTVWNTMVFSLTHLGEYNKALKGCMKSLECCKGKRLTKNLIWNKAVALNNMGWVYNYLGEYNKAIEVCKKAINLNLDFANPYNHSGFAHYRLGNIEKGIKLIQKSYSMNLEYCGALSNLSLIYYELKKHEKSFNACYQCMKLDVRFKEAQTVFRKLIHNPDLKKLSLMYHTLNVEFSPSFLKFLQWLKKHL